MPLWHGTQFAVGALPHRRNDDVSKVTAATMASSPCRVRADGAARLRRSAAPSADICRFAEIVSVKPNFLRLLSRRSTAFGCYFPEAACAALFHKSASSVIPSSPYNRASSERTMMFDGSRAASIPGLAQMHIAIDQLITILQHIVVASQFKAHHAGQPQGGDTISVSPPSQVTSTSAGSPSGRTNNSRASLCER